MTVPNIFATQPAGTLPASMLDANFAAVMPLTGGTFTSTVTFDDGTTWGDGVGVGFTSAVRNDNFKFGSATIDGSGAQPLWDFIDQSQSAGGGWALRFFARDTNGLTALAAVINAGFTSNTAGATRGDIDFVLYTDASVPRMHVALDGITQAFIPNGNNLYGIGASGARWATAYVQAYSGDTLSLATSASVASGVVVLDGTTGVGSTKTVYAWQTTAIPAGGTAGVGFRFSSVSNFGHFFGSGAPSLSAAQGSLYLRSDGLPYYNTNGSTGWGQLASLTYVETQTGNVRAYQGSVNFNAANTDTAITITLPTGYTRYHVQAVRLSNASGTLTTATAGLFTSAAGAGVAIVTGATAITVSTAAEDTLNNSMGFTVNNSATQSYTDTTLFFRVATAQGVAATGTVSIFIVPLP